MIMVQQILQSDVWCLLTCIDDYGTADTWTGLKYLEYNPGSELNIFYYKQWINEKAKESNETKVEQRMNENIEQRTK